VAARSVEDVLAGRGVMVLGELHTGFSTLMIPAVLKDSPWLDELLHADREDVPDLGVWPIVPKSRSTRPDFGPRGHVDYEVETGRTGSSLPRDRVLSAAELILERAGSQLAITTRDRRVSFDVINFFQSYLHPLTQLRFHILEPGPHTPRVMIDNLVVARESWQLATSELAFATVPRGLDQLVAARRWALAHDIPRYTFVKTSEERKPMFIDLASPLCVENLAKLARGSRRITLSEMVPAMDELWLPDGEGRVYTCELRTTAVDPIRWTPPP
jgi:hypothetical protein